MFIKWQSRTNPKDWSLSAHYYAYLVENYREGRKVRQRVISYLGSITGRKEQNEEIFYPGPRMSFYDHVQKNLDKLNISKKEKMKIFKTLSLKIPRPSLKEIRRAKAEFKAWKEGLKTLLSLRRR